MQMLRKSRRKYRSLVKLHACCRSWIQFTNVLGKKNIPLNAVKLKALGYQHPKPCVNLTDYSVSRGITILESKSVQDLCINNSDDTCFQVHVSSMVTKCKKLADWVLRTFRTREMESMMIFWRIFFVKRLDYRTQLSSHHIVRLTAEHEVTQQGFTNYIYTLAFSNILLMSKTN